MRRESVPYLLDLIREALSLHQEEWANLSTVLNKLHLHSQGQQFTGQAHVSKVLILFAVNEAAYFIQTT